MAEDEGKSGASKTGNAETSTQTNPSAAKNQGQAATETTAGNPTAKPEKTIGQKVEGAFEAVLDVLTDAEQLHHKLEPEISTEPE